VLKVLLRAESRLCGLESTVSPLQRRLGGLSGEDAEGRRSGWGRCGQDGEVRLEGTRRMVVQESVRGAQFVWREDFRGREVLCGRDLHCSCGLDGDGSLLLRFDATVGNREYDRFCSDDGVLTGAAFNPGTGDCWIVDSRPVGGTAEDSPKSKAAMSASDTFASLVGSAGVCTGDRSM